MIYYKNYQAPDEAVDQLVQGTLMGRLVTVSPDGAPHIGLYPFTIDARIIDLHLHHADEQLVDLNSNTRCLFEVDEVLAVVPSYWEDPEFGAKATAYHRTAIFECAATTSADPATVAKHQNDILNRYQPEGGYRPVTASDPMYAGMVGKLVRVSLEIQRYRAKFKLGQNRTAEVRREIIRQLRSRGRPNDDRAADALQWTLDREDH